MSWANITANARRYVMDVLNREWLSYSLYQPRFEREVARLHNAKHGILVNSGTDALRISLATLKEIFRWPDNSEIIVPSVTFVATVNAVLQTRLRPIFCDVDLVTCVIQPTTIARVITKRSMAIIPVHLFGLPVPIPETKLKVIEDSCETFGVHKLTGDMMCMSFYMSHHVATGIGGMILTNSERYEKVTRSFANHGRIDDGSHFEFGRVGYSSRITEMEAALGVAALEHFHADLEKRRTLARHYIFGLQDLSDKLQITPMHPDHSFMFYPIRLLRGSRDALLAHLRASEIESREAMPLINQPVFRDYYTPGSCPNAENWTKNGLLLPLHPKMDSSDVERVCDAIKRF